MNTKRVLVATFALGILLSASHSALGMEVEIEKKTCTCGCNQQENNNEDSSAKTEYKNLKKRITDTASSTASSVNDYIEDNCQTAQDWWDERDNFDKTAMILGTVGGYYGYSYLLPSAAAWTTPLLVGYLMYKGTLAPKPAEKSWWKEITDDICNTGSWIKSWFISSEEDQEEGDDDDDDDDDDDENRE